MDTAQSDLFRPLLLLLLLLSFRTGWAQSLELMAGDKYIFADIQWLKPLDEKFRRSVFSRTRATVDYDNNTDVFTGAYLNFTTKPGIGASIVGKIGNAGGGADAGVHIFKSKKEWILFGLVSTGVKKELEYSWFSIFRYTPAISERWKLYTGLELFTLLNRSGHVFSVQRIRLGLDIDGHQFGLAGNLSEAGRKPAIENSIGGFFRKSF